MLVFSRACCAGLRSRSEISGSDSGNNSGELPFLGRRVRDPEAETHFGLAEPSGPVQSAARTWYIASLPGRTGAEAAEDVGDEHRGQGARAHKPKAGSTSSIATSIPRSRSRDAAVPEQSLVGLSADLWRAFAPRLCQGLPLSEETPLASRRDAWPPGGGLPASDLDFMRAQHLDLYGIEHAIMNPLSPSGQGDQNDEYCARWRSPQRIPARALDAPGPAAESSVVVPYEDGEASRTEIRARAGDSASPTCSC